MLLEGPGNSSVKVIADSVSAETGDRIMSLQVTGWRFTLAEVNTHCLFVRNSASSRAIPVLRRLEDYRVSPAYPVQWPCERKGMSGGEELTGEDLASARELFQYLRGATAEEVEHYLSRAQRLYGDEWRSHVLHKSLLNRLLEPMQWHTMLLTFHLPAENFFTQRANSKAQPEFRVVAEMMRQAAEEHVPAQLRAGEWHLPYAQPDDGDGYDPRYLSAARCARLSYLTQEGLRDPQEDINLANRLMEDGHWSPYEHVCVVDPRNVTTEDIWDESYTQVLGTVRKARVGKFPGWRHFRHIAEARRGYDSYG